MKRPPIIYAAILCLFFTACNQKHEQALVLPEGQYAQGFSIEQRENCTVVTVADPWKQGKIMQRYYLATDTTGLKAPDGVLLQVPVRRLAATSCTHAGFLDALEATGVLCGICSPSLVYTPIPSEEEGCADLGDAMQVNGERVLLTLPDAIMISTYAQGDGARQYLEKSGMPVIYNNEWMEHSPLGRAEWIRFVGAFLNKQHEADSLFRQIAAQYEAVKQLVQDSVSQRKTLLAGNNFRGTWYMPSGKVYTGQLYQDAGADYYFAADSTNGSIPLSVETVLLHFQDADVWVNSTSRSLDELREADKRHTWFKAYQTGEVYNFLRRSRPTGANDFWESAVVHPERLLQDLVKILYPNLLPDYEFYYAEKLEEGKSKNEK